MIRRLTVVFAVVAAAATLSSCATFSDNDAIARVGDEELSRADLADDTGDATDAGSVRAAISAWIGSRLPQPNADDYLARYAAGPVESRVACLNVIAVATPERAEEARRRLLAGEAFAMVAADELESANVGCVALDSGLDQADPAIAEALLALTFDDPIRVLPRTDPEQGDFQLLIQLRNANDVTVDELSAVVLPPAPADVDVYVDPRYGTWDRLTRRVVPLG